MALNMVISYFIGYKFKDFLISSISAAIYYQFIVFISLALPFIIKFLDRKIRLFILDIKIKKLRKEMSENQESNLDKNTKKMYNNLISSDIKTSEAIKSMHDELEALRK